MLEVHPDRLPAAAADLRRSGLNAINTTRSVACRIPHCVGASVCVHETPDRRAPGSRALMLTDYIYRDYNLFFQTDI